jgi:hypothetical protein
MISETVLTKNKKKTREDDMMTGRREDLAPNHR